MKIFKLVEFGNCSKSELLPQFYLINWIFDAETIQVRKLFKGGNYSRKYGNLKILQIWQQIWGPVMMEKIPLDIGNYILFLNCGFVIDSNISGKYQPIWVSVLILDLNQNSGFDRTLCGTNSSPLRHIMIQWIPQFF